MVYNGEEISPSRAAAFVLAHEGDLSYIPGRVRLDAPLPLTFQQLTELYRSNRLVSKLDEAELAVDLPDPADLPAFEARLADAIERALALPAHQCDVSGLSWERLTERVLAAAPTRE